MAAHAVNRVEDEFDFRRPDYPAVFKARAERLAQIRARPAVLEALRLHYKHNPDDFINDWGCTFEVRNPEKGLPALVPFILFPKQREWVRKVMECWKSGKPLITEKSRDCGLSWLSVALGCTLCLFWEGLNIGYGSRKEEYVDKIGVPKALFERGRQFLRYLPGEFAAGWTSAHMRIMFGATGSTMTGEAGDNIGRGDRASIYFTDEEAFLERPALVEASLSQTTNCRVSISTPNGMANPFAQKRWGGKIEVFTFHWRAQPLDAGILTPDGWRKMGDIQPGDFVIGPDGHPRRVQAVTPRSEKEVFAVEFSDGAVTECCGDHLWEVIPYQNQRAERRHIRKVLPLSEIMKDYVRVDARGYRSHRYQVPLVAPVHLNSFPLPLAPYVLGCLLGDGSLPARASSPLRLALSDADKEIAALVEAALPTGCKVRFDGGLNYRIAAEDRFRNGTRGRRNPINAAVSALGLSGRQSHEKSIPREYFRAAPEDRLELLRGLMDTDGHVPKSDPGAAIFSTVSPELARGVRELAESLGGTARIYEAPAALRDFPGGRRHACRVRYSVAVRLPAEFIPFKMARKAEAYQPAKRHPPHRSIVNIRPAGVKTVQCLSVEGGLYLTDHAIVTHNCDPRKDEAWYAKQVDELDPVTLAQEVDLDYSASVEGVLIPSAWVQSAIDAHLKLALDVTGDTRAALDVADEGIDTNALAAGKGILLSHLVEWSGKGEDIFKTTQRAFGHCDEIEARFLMYDADGLGAGVRGDARVINESRAGREIAVVAFRGSGAVDRPEAQDVKGRVNKDFFANAKAQAWWLLRLRFERTHRAVQEMASGVYPQFNPDDLISLSSTLPLLGKLQQELSQPTYSLNVSGKIVVDKKPDGTKSPNLADSVMIRYSQSRRTMRISREALQGA